MLKRFKIVGLCLVAVFALSAVAASSAFGASEFQVESGGTLKGTTIEGTGGVAKFETAKGEKIECEKSSSKGTVETATEAKVTVTYSGNCHATGSKVSGPCENGSKNIKTNELTISPGEKLGPGSSTTNIGLRFTATVLAKFKCEKTPLGAEVEVKGNLVCESVGKNVGPTSEYLETGEVVCSQSSAGVQKFTEIEIGTKKETKQELMASVFGISEKDAQTTTEKLKYNKKIRQT